jgi:putative ABC transport system permease protein
MNPIQIMDLAFEALRERKIRSILTILMVIMGASLIVALNGTGNGFSQYVDNQFATLGANVLILEPRGSALLDKTVVDSLAKFNGVSDVVPYMRKSASISSQGQTQATVIVGVDNSKLHILFPTLTLNLGSFVDSTDNSGILLGSEIVISKSGGVFATVGQTIVVNYQKSSDTQFSVVQKVFSVRGTLKSVGSSVVPVDQMVFISLSAAKSLFGRGNSYDGIYVIAQSPDLNSAVQAAITAKYGGDITLTSPQALADTINNVKSAVFAFISIIAYVSLMVAAVGIVATLHTSMMERIREIGLLKAIGFKKRLVLTLFLNEAMIIGLIGGSIGIVFGMVLSYGMSYLVSYGLQFGNLIDQTGFSLNITPAFAPSNLIFTWLICLSVSIVSGTYPAWRASRLDPVDALRHE